MSLERGRGSSLNWSAVLVALAVACGGCDQTQKTAKNADGRGAATSGDGAATKPDRPAAGERPDSPSHPAVSTQVGSSDESPNGKPAASANRVDNPSSDAPADESPHDSATGANGKPAATPVPPPGVLPSIALTAAHRATCKLLVGDTLPAFSAVDIRGTLPLPIEPKTRYSVYAFVQSGDAETAELMSDLAPLVTRPYGERGVSAVVVFVDEPTDAIKELALQHKNDFSTLVDRDGAALSQVTDDPQGLMPRIFLIDSAWRILWFDIEYSRTTRRDLDAALRYLTRQ